MTKQAFVTIYCKIYTDSFPDEGFTNGKIADGDSIYHFLTKQLNLSFIDDEQCCGQLIKGDYAIWYLATNEKFGILQVDDYINKWSFGQSNWQRVTEFINILYLKEVITKNQYNHLTNIIQEGMNAFDDMYEIPKYLYAKQTGQIWTKQQTNTKEIIKKMTQGITESLTKEGYEVLTPVI